MRSPALFLAALIMGTAPGSYASEVISLKEAVDLAMRKNHLVQAAAAETAAAEAGLRQSRARYLPRVILEERAALTNSGTRAFMMELDQGRFTLGGDLNHPGDTHDFQTSFTIEQPLLDMNLMSVIEVSDKESSARSHALEKSRQDVVFQVYAAYLNVQRSKALLSALEQAVRAAQEHRRLASVRSESGVGLRFDELRIGTFLADLEQQKITAENDVRLARLRLGQAAGLPPGSEPDIGKILTAMEMPHTPMELENAAFAHRPDIRKSAADVARGEAEIAAVKGTFWPTLYASGTYQINDRDLPFGSDNESWIIGASLRWEPFDLFRRRGELERARALRDAGESYQNLLRQEVSLQVNESLLRRTEAEKKLAVSRSALKDAEEMVRLVTRRFENGISTAVELLDAQTALNHSRSQLAENEAAFALSTARVYHSAGLLMKEVMK